MDLLQSMQVSSGGMAAQSQRIKMIAENVANADSVMTATGEAYRRKEIYFKAEVDRQTGLTNVVVDKISPDRKTPLKPVYDPSHQLADNNGFVLYPNVNTTVESVNMREASRGYEANLAAIETARDMMSRSLDMLR